MIVGVAMLREVDEVTLSLESLSTHQAPTSTPCVLERFRYSEVNAGPGVGRRHDARERVVRAPIRNLLQNSWRTQ